MKSERTPAQKVRTAAENDALRAYMMKEFR